MRPDIVRKDEQIRLIMECRKSGLSDYQWCKTREINPGTFYNWVSKLKKAGYTLPDPESRDTGIPVRQEVVKLDLVESEAPTPIMMGQNVSVLTAKPTQSVAAEIQLGTITLRLFNGADPLVIQNAIKCIGGVTHAW